MDSISKKIVSGTIYTAVGKYSSIVISLIVTAILARFISPSDFGVIAIATVFISFFSLLGDLGISAAIVQKKNIGSDDLNQYFTFSFYLALLLAILFALLSPFIVSYYNNESLEIILYLLTLQIFFATINMVPNAVLLKRQEFKFIANRTVIVHVVLGVISCIAAITGAGIYALLINPIFGAILIFVLNYFHSGRMKFVLKIHKESMSKICGYSVYQFLFTIQNYVFRNIDKLLIGKYLNMSQLGYYEKSYRLMMLPVQNISKVITPVLQPVLSEFQQDIETQIKHFNQVTKILAIIGFPISIFLFFSSREIILIVFGDNWLDAILPFKILSLSVASQMLSSTFGSIFQSTNNIKSQLYIGLINTIWSVSMILIGLFCFGTTAGVAGMFTIAMVVETIYNWAYVYKFIYRKPILSFYRHLGVAALMAILLTCVLFPVDLLTRNFNFLISFFIKAIVSLTLVLYIIQKFNIFNLKSLIGHIQKLWKKRGS